MPNRTSVKRFTRNKVRSGRTPRYGSASRSSKVSAKRLSVTRPSARKNTKVIKSNARKLRKLSNQMWGDYQEQKSRLSTTQPVFANGPVMFHVNNPACGTKGPYLHTTSFPTYNHATTAVHFNKYAGPSDVDNDEGDEKHIPNGPKLKLLFADFEFKFTGWCNDTRIRIDFIQQKNITTDFWNQNKDDQFLPQTLGGFRNIAGFDCNEIDRKNYRVLATRKIYLDASTSTSATTVALGMQTGDISDATTKSARYAHVRLKLNKVLKQLNSSINEASAQDVTDLPVNESDHPHGGAWAFDNQHPLSNIFCLISTDDVTSYDGDHVQVDVIRKLGWRDSRA